MKVDTKYMIAPQGNAMSRAFNVAEKHTRVKNQRRLNLTVSKAELTKKVTINQI